MVVAKFPGAIAYVPASAVGAGVKSVMKFWRCSGVDFPANVWKQLLNQSYLFRHCAREDRENVSSIANRLKRVSTGVLARFFCWDAGQCSGRPCRFNVPATTVPTAPSTATFTFEQATPGSFNRAWLDVSATNADDVTLEVVSPSGASGVSKWARSR